MRGFGAALRLPLTVTHWFAVVVVLCRRGRRGRSRGGVVVLLCVHVVVGLALGDFGGSTRRSYEGNVLECVADIHPSIQSRLEYFPARRTQTREDGARVCA